MKQIGTLYRLYIALGNEINKIGYSNNGYDWVNCYLNFEKKNEVLVNIIDVKNYFIALGVYSDRIYWSKHGTSYELIPTANLDSSGFHNLKWTTIAYNTDTKRIVLGTGPGSKQTLWSDDGINWTSGSISISGTPNLQSMAYGGGKFVAVSCLNWATSEASNQFAYSSDGISWTEGTLPSAQYWRPVVYGNGMFLTLSQVQNESLVSLIYAYSTNGTSWTQGSFPTAEHWISVAYGNGKFVVIGCSSNKALYSTNGTSWTAITLPVTAAWKSITFGDNKFVAVASDSNIGIISVDGINWSQITLPSVANWVTVESKRSSR